MIMHRDNKLAKKKKNIWFCIDMDDGGWTSKCRRIHEKMNVSWVEQQI